jgi:hypothetical protein
MWKIPRLWRNATVHPSLEDVPRYPPYAEGLPVIDVGLILASQEDLIEQLRTPLAQTKAEFAERTRPLIERYAAFVHLLPASEAHHHRGTGGLFRHGLEVAFHAVLRTEDMLFAMDLEPIDRRQVEPIWKYAVFLTGLFHDVGKPVGDLSVTDRDGNVEWNPMEESLMEWAHGNRLERYFLHWRRGRHKHHEELSMYIAPSLFGKDTRSYLHQGGGTILQAVVTALAGNDDGTIHDLVQQADEDSTARDIKTNPGAVSAGGGASLGVPVERHLRDAMRRLLADEQWTVNQPGSKVWVFADGVYVVWVGAVTDIGRLLSKDKIPGIPKDKEILADILIERGLAVAQQTSKGTRKYWRVAPMPLVREGREPIELTMLKLSDPSVLFDGASPPVVERYVAPAAETTPAKNQSATNAGSSNTVRAHRSDPETGEVLDESQDRPSEPLTEDRSDGPPAEPNDGPVDDEVDRDAWLDQTEDSWRQDGAERASSGDDAVEGSRQQALETLRTDKGEEGQWLADIVEQVGVGTLVVGVDYLFDPYITLAWPDLAKRQNQVPRDLLMALDAKGWLRANPDNAMRKIIDEGTVRGIQLTADGAELFRRAVGCGDEPIVPLIHFTPETMPHTARNPASTAAAPSEVPHDMRDAPMGHHVGELLQLVWDGAELPGGTTRENGRWGINYSVASWYAGKHGLNRKLFLEALHQDSHVTVIGKSQLWITGQ